MTELILFVVLALTVVTGALTTVLARNPVHSAVGLLGTLFSLAVLYVVNLAHLVAVVQVIVYAGAVMTLFLFVIMMIGVDQTEDRDETLPGQRKLIASVALGLLALGAVAAISGELDWFPGARAAVPEVNGTVGEVAKTLFTDWVLAFEATALLLTIAAAGTIALASFKKGDEK